MDYQLGKSESVGDGFQRIGSEVINLMRRGVTAADVEGIHEARKGCKWLRASLRLLRSALEPKAVTAELRIIRNLARMLGGVRDATIRLVSFRSLGVEGYEELERRLEREAHAEHRHHLDAEGQQNALLALDALAKGWSGLRLANGEWRHVGTGIERSYRRARKGFRRMEEKATDETIHEWRKRTKDLLYHVRMIQLMKPGKLGRLEKRLDDLGEWLGFDHDLIVLTAFLQKDRHLSANERCELLTQINKRRKEHLTAARHVAEMAFQKKPGKFARELKRWWKSWRKD